MGAGRHNFPPLQAGLDAQASGGNAHQALDVFAIAVGLLLNEVGQLDGVFGTGGQCSAHGVQIAAKDAVISGKAGCLKARVLQHGLGWANQFGMLLGVADAAQLAPYPDRGASDLLEGANAPPTGPGHCMQCALICGGASLFVIVQVGAVNVLGNVFGDIARGIPLGRVYLFPVEAGCEVGKGWGGLDISSDDDIRPLCTGLSQ